MESSTNSHLEKKVIGGIGGKTDLLLFSARSTLSQFPADVPEYEEQDSGRGQENDSSGYDEGVDPAESLEANRPSVSVLPTTREAVALPPLGMPSKGVMFENESPANVQTFQVPGVGMPVDQSQQVPFIFINNVAADSSKARAMPGVAEAVSGGSTAEVEECSMRICWTRDAAVDALCVSTLGAPYRYSPRKKLCEPSNLIAAEEEAANAEEARLIAQPATPQEAYEEALMGEAM
ncbi:hypothetical protein Efla_004743 [Eimeria flavescens]